MPDSAGESQGERWHDGPAVTEMRTPAMLG